MSPFAHATHAAHADGRRHPLLAPLAGVALLHLLGFGLLLAVVAPGDLVLGTGEAFGIGLGITAYTLGMRHAFDADHIAAIDNTTRKLLREGTRPHASGFFFSAGHSTVVLVLVLLVALGASGLGGAVADEHSTLHRITSVWGPTVAGSFLVVIGLLNLAMLRGSLALARAARSGTLAPGELERRLAAGHGGPLSRLTQRVAGRVTAPWQLYPVGLLFGLGFDTATEIALLVLAGGGAATGVPFLAILSLPLLFAAGMTLLDTLNGAAMTKAYGAAQQAPIRRIAYDVTVTGLSVVFALGIGTLSLAGVAAEQLGVDHGPIAALASVDVGLAGFILLALVLSAWAAASVRWRLTRDAAPGLPH